MVKVAIMGHGTVGSGVYEVFEMNAEKIARGFSASFAPEPRREIFAPAVGPDAP